MGLPPRLGRLRQVSRLGAGGFASVWLYHDDELDSSVAVKALADNWCQHPAIRARFLEEARILRRADSDHVVRVYDVGETDDGTPYFVMSYADRGTLADRLVEAPLPPQEVAELLRAAGHGVTVLHRIGVVHRDIKPQNLLLRSAEDGSTRLVVADLGVAKAVAYASGLTQVVGTPAYMAPEQADPTLGLDQRADVHALGAVAYQLLTGVPLRDGSLDSVTRAALPAPPTAMVDNLPSAVDDVIGRAVMPDRNARWPDVASFTDALCEATQPVKAGTAVLATPPWDRTRLEASEPSAAKRRGRLLPALLGALVALVLVAGAGGAYLLTRDDRAGANPEDPQSSETPDAISLQLPTGWEQTSSGTVEAVYTATGTGDYDEGTTLRVQRLEEDTDDPYTYLYAVSDQDALAVEDGGRAEYSYDFIEEIPEYKWQGSWQLASRYAYTYFSEQPLGTEIWALGRYDRTDVLVTLTGAPKIVDGDEEGDTYDRANVPLMREVAEQLDP